MSVSNQSLVGFFREAAPYIHMHQGKVFVVAISGEALERNNAPEILGDIALLSTLGARIILVHGARPQIDKQLSKENHPSDIYNGLRITDDKTLAIAKKAIGQLRIDIENYLNQAFNKPPIINNGPGVLSGNLLSTRPVGILDGVDHLLTGRVRKINTMLLEQLLVQSNIILMSPIGHSPIGQTHNLRYEEVAACTATTIKADKLIIIQDMGDSLQLPRQLNLNALKQLNKHHAIPLLDDIDIAVSSGVNRAHIIQPSLPGGVILELYTRDGVSCMIDNGDYDTPRPANEQDIQGIIELITPWQLQGILAKRSREQIEAEINYFSVIERDGRIIGCAALYPHKNHSSAELACLVIDPKYRSGSRGSNLAEHMIDKARRAGLEKVFLLTTQSIDWFKERGFEEMDLGELPTSKQLTYNTDRNSRALSLTIR